ncbi:hypothetical protein ACHAXA_001806 [Cyclostephanos tholiformis]|uniref:Cyclin-like domain-containing protein n=1 Tax=Cyclostephanos tholiformis TaxID=382380 RepID=A0ABD3SDQ9_9STRA
MMAQEVSHSCCNYLYNDDSSNNDLDEYKYLICLKITADDRSKIVDWCYCIIEMCQLDRESVTIAMNIVDRFMSNPCRRPSNGIFTHFSHKEILYDRIKYQLLAVSALYIAIKVNEQVTFSSEKLAVMSRGIYSKENIEAMERTILECLSWRVCAPTALQVGSVILELMIIKVQEVDVSIMDVRRWESIRDKLALQTEIAVRDYQLAVQQPSTVAFMALLNAIKIDRNVNDCEQELLLNCLLDTLLQVKRLSSDE